MAVRRRHLAAVVDGLDTTPDKVVMVGDSGNDINTAKALNVRAVAVSFGYPRMPVEELGADAVIDHFDDLWKALEALA